MSIDLLLNANTDIKDDIGDSEISAINRYPRVQWHSKQRGPKGSVLGDGGFMIRVDLVEDFYPDLPFDKLEYTFENGDSTMAYLFPDLHFCLVGKPVMGNSYYDSFLGNYRLWKNKNDVPSDISNVKFKLWQYVYIKEFLPYSDQPIPFILSLTQSQAINFNNARKKFLKDVIGTANKLKQQSKSPGRLSNVHFYFPLKSSGIVTNKWANRTWHSANVIPNWNDDIVNVTPKTIKPLTDLLTDQELQEFISQEGLAQCEEWFNDMQSLYVANETTNNGNEPEEAFPPIETDQAGLYEGGYNPFAETI